MPNYYLSVLYKHIIQVENKNVGLKVGGHKHTIAPPPSQKSGGHMPPLPPRFLRQCVEVWCINIENGKSRCTRTNKYIHNTYMNTYITYIHTTNRQTAMADSLYIYIFLFLLFIFLTETLLLEGPLGVPTNLGAWQ